jgi:hypothetical protein
MNLMEIEELEDLAAPFDWRDGVATYIAVATGVLVVFAVATT